MKESAVSFERARAIVEAVLLTADAPVSPGRLAELLDGLGGREIRQIIDALKEEYDKSDRGFTIVEVAGGFQLATRRELAPWIRRFHRNDAQVRLSQAALETLAIVAFKQPITRVEIESIRGVNSSGVLHTLMELDLVRIVGRSDGIGKPMLFGTTREFLVHFGLKSLADLPRPKELEELLAEGEQKARAQLAPALTGEGGEGGNGAPSAGTPSGEEGGIHPETADGDGSEGGEPEGSNM